MAYFKSSLENIITIKKNVLFFYNEYNGPVYDKGEAFNFWELTYVIEGTLVEVTDTESVQVHKNQILLHKPNEFHITKNISDDAYLKACFISFECNSKAMEFFCGYHGDLSPASQSIIEKLVEEGRRNFVFSDKNSRETMLVAPGAQIGSQQMYRILLEALLINILREQVANTDNFVFTSKEEFYNDMHGKILNYLADNLYSDISVSDICKKFNYSRTFLSSRFKEYTGTSIMNYYSMLKIEEACRLIKEKNYTISHISNLLSFNNPYYFSKVFKKIKGITPSEYKKTIKQ